MQAQANSQSPSQLNFDQLHVDPDRQLMVQLQQQIQRLEAQQQAQQSTIAQQQQRAAQDQARIQQQAEELARREREANPFKFDVPETERKALALNLSRVDNVENLLQVILKTENLGMEQDPYFKPKAKPTSAIVNVMEATARSSRESVASSVASIITKVLPRVRTSIKDAARQRYAAGYTKNKVRILDNQRHNAVAAQQTAARVLAIADARGLVLPLPGRDNVDYDRLLPVPAAPAAPAGLQLPNEDPFDGEDLGGAAADAADAAMDGHWGPFEAVDDGFVVNADDDGDDLDYSAADANADAAAYTVEEIAEDDAAHAADAAAESAADAELD